MSGQIRSSRRHSQGCATSSGIQKKKRWLLAATTLAVSTDPVVAFVPKLGISIFSKSPRNHRSSSSNNIPVDLSNPFWSSNNNNNNNNDDGKDDSSPFFNPYGENTGGNPFASNSGSGGEPPSDPSSSSPFGPPQNNNPFGGYNDNPPNNNGNNNQGASGLPSYFPGGGSGSKPQAPRGANPFGSYDASQPSWENDDNNDGPRPKEENNNSNNNQGASGLPSYFPGGGSGSKPQAPRGANPFGSYDASNNDNDGPLSKEENDDYYEAEMKRREELQEQRQQDATRGLQERTAGLLKQAEAKRLAGSQARREREDLVEEAQQAVQEQKRQTDPRQANAQWQAESDARVSDAAEAARRKSEEMKRMYEEKDAATKERRSQSEERARAEATAAARARAEALRREWEAEHPQQGGQTQEDTTNYAVYGSMSTTQGTSSQSSVPPGSSNPYQPPPPTSQTTDTNTTPFGAGPPKVDMNSFPFSSSQDTSSEGEGSSLFGNAWPSSSTQPQRQQPPSQDSPFRPPFQAGKSPFSGNMDSTQPPPSPFNPFARKEEQDFKPQAFSPFGSSKSAEESNAKTPPSSNPFESYSAQSSSSSSSSTEKPKPAAPSGGNPFSPFGPYMDNIQSQSGPESASPSDPNEDADDYYAAEMARRAALQEARKSGQEGPTPAPAVFTPLDAQAFNQEAEKEKARFEEEKRREEAKAAFKAQQDQPNQAVGPPTNDFKAQQAAAIKAEEEARLEAERRRAEEAKRQEEEANRLRSQQEAQRKAAADEEETRRGSIRAAEEKARGKLEDSNRMRAQEDQQRKAEQDAIQKRIQEARRRAAEEQKEQMAKEAEERRKAEEARLASIEAARKLREKEQAKKKEEEAAKKRVEEERFQQARKRVEEKRYKAEAETDRQEIKDFVQSKRRELDAKRVQKDDDQRIDDEARFRAEEARRWAEQEARRKKGGQSPEDEEDTRIRNVYAKWCEFYGKRFDESRLETFAGNLLEIERHFSTSGGPVQLNEFADLTAEEYQLHEEDPIVWEENELMRAQEQERLWEEEERLRLAEGPWGEDDFEDLGMPPPADVYAPPAFDEDPWRRDEGEWGFPPRQTPATASNIPNAMDEARKRGEFDATRRAELESRKETERKKVEDAEKQRMEEAKRRGEATARMKAEEEAQKKAEEEVKQKAIDDAKRRGEEEAKRKAEAEARQKEEGKKMEEARQKALEEARIRGEAALRQKTEAERREAERELEAKRAQGADLSRNLKKDNMNTNEEKSESSKNAVFPFLSGKGGSSTQQTKQDEQSLSQVIKRNPEAMQPDQEPPSFSAFEKQIRRDSSNSMKSPAQDKAMDAWNAALQRGQDVARQRAEQEAKRKEEAVRMEEEKRNFFHNAAERARYETQKRVEAAEKKEREAEEAHNRVLNEAKRRAEEEQRKRAEAQAKKQEEIVRLAELDRQRKEDAKLKATEAAKRREAEQRRIREEQARKAEDERRQTAEARQRAAEEAKQKAEEVAKQREEQIRLALEEQRRKRQEQEKAADQAKRRAQEIEMKKADQLKRVQEERRQGEEMRKKAEAERRTEQEAREVARLGARRQAALDLAKKKEEQEALRRRKDEEARTAARAAAKKRNEDEQRRREELTTKTRLIADQDLRRKREAAFQFNSSPKEGSKPKDEQAKPRPSDSASYEERTSDQSGTSIGGKPNAPTGQPPAFGSYLSSTGEPDSSRKEASQAAASSQANYNPFQKPAKPSSEIEAPNESAVPQTNVPSNNSDPPTTTSDLLSSFQSGSSPKTDETEKKSYSPFGSFKKGAEVPATGLPSFVPRPKESSSEGRDEKKSFSPFGSYKPSKYETPSTGLPSYVPPASASEQNTETPSFGSYMNSIDSSTKRTDEKKSWSPFGTYKQSKSEPLSTGIPSYAPPASSSEQDTGTPSFGSYASPTDSNTKEADEKSSIDSNSKGTNENTSWSPFGSYKSATSEPLSTGLPSYVPSASASEQNTEIPSFGSYASPKESKADAASPFGEASAQRNQFGESFPGADAQITDAAAEAQKKAEESQQEPQKDASSAQQKKIPDDTTAAKVQAELARRQAADKKERADRAIQTAQQLQGEADKWNVGNATTGKPRESTSYMDKVAKSFVAGSNRLEQLNQDIANMSENLNVQGDDEGLKEKDKGTKNKEEGGIMSFVSRFFGNTEKAEGVKKEKNSEAQKQQQWEEGPDGSLRPTGSFPQRQEPSNPQQEDDHDLPFFLSNSRNSGQVITDGGGSSSSTQSVATAIPTISAWAQTPEGSIHGFISGSPNFEDGAYIVTTPVENGAEGGSIVTTASGSQYRLSAEQQDNLKP